MVKYPSLEKNNLHNSFAHNARVKEIYSILENIPDPEIPVLNILDLGIVRDVKLHDDAVEVVITPTYSGCPAMDAIAADIRFRLLEAGQKNIRISTVLHPAWTTDWMSEEGREKLRSYGIAPPARLMKDGREETACPQCGSKNTKVVSAFGSTACKELCQCNDCLEFFDHFKCH